FRSPPPLPSLGLTEEETAELLGDRANRRIYENPDPFERANGGLFRLTIPFRRRSEGVISSFSLGALGIREGSERIFLGDRLLTRGVDYEIDYDVGQVRLLEPEVLFAGAREDAVRATWEQQQIFQTAPISVFGFQGSTRLGDAGGLNLIGLYRTEKTLVNRPTLGVEPGAVGLAGLSGDLTADVPWLDQLLTHVPGLRFSGSSSFTVDGEAALSLPDPNTRGAVFVDDFDASNERPLSLLAHEWDRGSAPAFVDGAETALPSPVDASTLGELIWQHTWIVEGVEDDSVGIHEGFLPRDEIDAQIRVAGSSVREPGLRLTFGQRQSFSGTRWASITTTLSQTGADLTKSEYLEFYVSGGEASRLIIDLGVVDEDAVFVGPDGATSGVKANGAPWGLGILDQEADPVRGEIWGQDADERGVWGEGCRAEPGRIYRLGDARAVCTRNNGRQDSEDLDGDGNLDSREKYLRYVVELSGASPYLARTRSETLTDFRLYRIPLEDLRAVEVGGVVTEADLRAVKNVRLTL
ncbi:MAG TPA: hypothetical protein VLL48_12075, partial [Longimicrobiales bacterium]|nr:hypothetical protein [Longimicrobiales bacterium]